MTYLELTLLDCLPTGCGGSSLGTRTVFTCDIDISEVLTFSETHYAIIGVCEKKNQTLTNQVLKYQIVEHVDVSLLCLFLLLIHYAPEGIHVSHIYQFVCIDLPGIAITKRDQQV